MSAIIYEQGAVRTQADRVQKPFHYWTTPAGSIWAEFYRCGEAYLVRFPGLADFEVSADGQRVLGWPSPATSAATTQHLYLNQVVPLALSRQGKLVLHASAVELAGQAIAFLGASGRGKSTLAASFATAGARFLTDDGLELLWIDGELRASPSHPSIRLWQDSEHALLGGGKAKAMEAVEFTSKGRFLAGGPLAFCDSMQTVARLYFLGDGSCTSPALRRVQPQWAMIELIKNSFLLDVDEHAMLARHFDGLSRIVNLPILFGLDYPRRYDELPRVREFIGRNSVVDRRSKGPIE